MPTLTLDTFRRLLAKRRRGADRPGFDATRPATGERGNLIFRLRSWPQLPEDGRTAEIYRILSVMSSQPVNRHWLLTRSRMAPREIDALMAKLVAEGAVEVIDPARFGQNEPCGA